VTCRDRLRSIAAAALVACAVVTPQLWLYHAASGHWLINSYGDLGFTLASPHVAGVLWSARKGVFFYAPVLLLGVAGIPIFPQGLRRWRAAAAIVLSVHTYVIASWWDWQFGASFGHRGFVDVYPVFALGMAAAFARLASYRRARVAAFASVVALCALSIFQMLQYWHGVLPHADLTWRGYRDVFLKTW
jgi:peptidoglycan/LPS O-acetylase OafA/YrhL